MGIAVLAVLVCAVVALAVFKVQQYARWHREQPGDEAWIAELQRLNRMNDAHPYWKENRYE
jgi:hypothetical protein